MRPTFPYRRHGRVLLALAAVVGLSGCADLYFHRARTDPPTAVYTLEQWPWREYWTGIVFTGNKIGFSHLALDRLDAEPQRFRIAGEAAMRFKFLTVDKSVTLFAEDIVDEDLHLLRFHYRYVLDGNELELNGDVSGSRLNVQIKQGEQTRQQQLDLTEPLYPASAIALVPLHRGLVLGREYRYMVYSGETQKLAESRQAVRAFEESDLFHGPAFRIDTSLLGQKATTWMDAKGQPLFELSQHGTIISHLETESRARRYLAEAALSKRDSLLEFSLVRSEPIDRPRDVRELRVVLSGLEPGFRVPSDFRQTCVAQGKASACRVNIGGYDTGGVPVMSKSYLGNSLSVPGNHPRIRSLAASIVGEATRPAVRAELLINWLQKNIEREAVDAFSALDVLKTRKAECQGHSYLFAAFARSLNIPTRVVNGIVYSAAHNGFLYHTWVESLLSDQWVAIDPTFGQLHADATHIKLVEGEELADLTPLAALVGQLSLEIEHVGY